MVEVKSEEACAASIASRPPQVLVLSDLSGNASDMSLEALHENAEASSRFMVHALCDL